MPTASTITGDVPVTDLVSFLLDGILGDRDGSIHPRFESPVLLSAEEAAESHLSLLAFRSLVLRLAQGLRDHGLQDGDHVMLISPNYITATVAALGVIAAGGVFCAAQPDLKQLEYLDQFVRDQPKFLLVYDEDGQLESVLQAWKDADLPVHGRIWIFDQHHNVQPRDAFPDESFDVDQSNLPHWTQLLRSESGFEWRRLSSVDECETPCMLFTTSGTSGLRKAAIYSHRNIVASIYGRMLTAKASASAAVSGGDARHLRSSRSILHTISVSRAMGTMLPLAIILAAQYQEVRIYFMSKTYVDMDPYLRIIQDQSITDISCAPFTLSRLFKSSTPKTYDFSALRTVTAVGAPSSKSALESARTFLLANKAPSSLLVGRALGLTEACALVSSFSLAANADEDTTAEGYQGRLEPNISAKIMPHPSYNYAAMNGGASSSTAAGSDDADNEEEKPAELTDFTPGELYLRGPSFIKSYYPYMDPTASTSTTTATTQTPAPASAPAVTTTRTFSTAWHQAKSDTDASFTSTISSSDAKEEEEEQHWFKTGDIAYLDRDRLYLLDRAKDVLKTPDSVPAAFIEGVLATHPAVADAGVVGVYEEELGLQLVRAYLVRVSSSGFAGGDGGGDGDGVTGEEIEAWMRERSANTAWITCGVVFLDSLPRDSGGKLLRRELRVRCARELGREVEGLNLPVLRS